jgi:hypothetical protein
MSRLKNKLLHDIKRDENELKIWCIFHYLLISFSALKCVYGSFTLSKGNLCPGLQSNKNKQFYGQLGLKLSFERTCSINKEVLHQLLYLNFSENLINI